MSSRPKHTSFFALVGPGVLLAATGIGGGDLATASFVGDMLGTAVLWAAVVAAALKFVVTEGIARWQLATGETVLEGAARRLGRVVIVLFLPYLLLWSFFVASAQMSANGVALHGLLPFFEDARIGKIVFGMLAGLTALSLVLFGGYRAFEYAMRACIGVTFVTIVVTAAMLWPGTGAVLEGLFVPRIPDVEGEPIVWTVALIGGLGGTLTVLCYGYWLREDGRTAPEDLRTCRIDIAASYVVTAVFGIAMMIVGSNVHIEGEGTALLVELSRALGEQLGPVGKWLFLVGTCGTVFASMLGVWQSAPYLFADCWRLVRDPDGPPTPVDRRALPYRGYLVVLALVPMIGLFFSFREVQKIYTVIGAYVFPLLALTLLVFNGRASWVGQHFKNRPVTAVALAGVLAFFTALAVLNIGG